MKVEVIKTQKKGKHKQSLLNVQRLEHIILSQSIQKGKANKDTRMCKDKVVSPSIIKEKSKESRLKMSR